MTNKVDTSKDFTDDDLQGIARRVANNAVQSAESADRAAVYCGHLFRDHVYASALEMLRTVALHERQRAGRDTASLKATHFN